MENSLTIVLIVIEHHIKVDEQSVFSFSITCPVLQIFTVLDHACDVIFYSIQYAKQYGFRFRRTLESLPVRLFD